MQIDLLKADNQTIFSSDEETTAEIVFYGGNPANASIQSNMFRAVKGEYKFDPLLITQMPGTYSVLAVTFGNFGRYQTMQQKQNITFLENAPLIVVKSRECRLGERYSDEHTCEQCEEGRNTYEVRTMALQGKACDDCLSFGVCEGKAIY